MRALIELLLPPHCPGCGREGSVLCDECKGPLHRRLAEPPGAPIGLPVAWPDGVLQLEWCAMFSGSIRGAIHALKYRGDRRLIEPLADALAERWASVAVGGDQVTWVPVHETRRRERGFDQAEELAKGMAERLHIPAAACLERRYKTDAQHALGRQDRAGNIEGVFAVPPAVREAVSGHWLVLVDDVITTGATLASCTAALYAGGAAAVSAITLARDR